MKATDETKQKAKDMGIKKWHVKSEERLKEEMLELDGRPAHAEAVEVIKEKATPKKPKLPSDVTPELMSWSIKCVGTKSPYWKYKDIL